MKSYMVTCLLVLILGVNINHINGQTISQSEFSQISTQEIPLFKKLGIVQGQWQKKENFEIRRRSVELNALILSPLSVNSGDKIEINLFDGERYTVKLNRVVVDVNNIFSMSGRIDGTEHGHFYLSAKDGITLATIEVLEKSKKYIIAYDRTSGIHHVTEVDPLYMDDLECAPPLLPEKDKGK